MKHKRLLSAILSSTLVLSMGATAFAFGEADDPAPVTPPASDPSTVNFSYAGETWTQDDVVISVIAPTATSSNIILNPYGLTYLENDQAKSDKVVTGGFNYIENTSKVPLQVDWQVTGSKTGNVNLIAKKPAVDAATNDLVLPVAITAVENKKVKPQDPVKTSASSTLAVSTEEQKSGALAKDAATYKGATAVSQPVILDNPNWTYSWLSVNDNTTPAYHNKNAQPYLAFGILGEDADGDGNKSGTGEAYINTNTTKLTNEWTKEDTVSVNMVFTFSKAPAFVVEGDHS